MKKLRLFHILFLILVILMIAFVFARIKKWVRVVSFDEISETDDSVANYENHDSIMPLTDEQFKLIRQKEEVILVLGNEPFAEDRGREDSLAAMLERATGGEVINCAVEGSCMSMEEPAFDISRSPMNIFSPYYLSCVACSKIDYEADLQVALNASGDDLPKEGEEVLKTLKELDMDRVDVVVIFYDGADYLKGVPTGLDEKRFDDPYCTFLGSFSATVEMIRSSYPGIRFIVMSAPYMYHVSDDGVWEPNEDHPNTEGASLSDYVMAQYNLCVSGHDLSFLDDYYTGVNLNDGYGYLTDGRHLNTEGRKLLCDRLLYAINFYDSENMGKVDISAT